MMSDGQENLAGAAAGAARVDTAADGAGYGVVRRLSVEAEAARSLMLNIRDVIGDDDEAIADAIEGETSFNEAVSDAIDRLSEIDSFADAIGAREKELAERRARFISQAERIRTSIGVAMGVAGIKKLELAQATISVRKVPPHVVILNEADVPARFWKPRDPALDRKAVLAALKTKEDVPGASLSNGSETISIKAT